MESLFFNIDFEIWTLQVSLQSSFKLRMEQEGRLRGLELKWINCDFQIKYSEGNAFNLERERKSQQLPFEDRENVFLGF